MKNMLALVGLIVVGVAGAGWYCGWYEVKSVPTTDGHRSYNVNVNTKEIVEDLTKVKEKVGEVVSNETKGTSTGTSTIPVVDNNNNSPGVHFGPNGSPVIVLPKLEIKTGN